MSDAGMTIGAAELETLFDALPNVVFFIKDQEGCYTHANMTLVSRLGMKRRSELIGRTAAEVFPDGLGGLYFEQDRRVLSGAVIEDQLEMHLFPNHKPGWCLTCKRPVRVGGSIRGLIGISRDLRSPDGQHPTYDRLRRVAAHLQQHYAGPVRVQALADLADLSVSQLERQFRHVFLLTPRQVLNKLRIETAMQLLHGDASVASVSAACGFTDQSAFTRRFRSAVGMSPRAFRKRILGRSVARD